MLLAHELATLAKNLIKHRVDRTRPRSAGSMGERRPKPGSRRAKEETSFPSGHTAGAVSVARAFARDYPEYGPPALAAAGLIAVAQVPRSAHYASDVVAGALIALAAEAAASAVWHGSDAAPAAADRRSREV